MPILDLRLREAGDVAVTPKTPPKFFSAQILQASRFHLDLNPSPGRRLSVVSGGREHCSPDYHMRRGGFPYLAIEFVAGGTGRLTLGGREVRLVPGTVFSYGPRVAHDIFTDRERPLVKYFVDFAGSAALQLLRAIPLTPGAALQTSAPSEVMALLDELIRSGARATRYARRISAGLLEVLLLKLAETCVSTGSFEGAAFATYQQCRRTLEERWLSIRSLRDLAAACGLDEAYLCRLFRRFGDASPYQYLLRLKMNHAAARLQEPGTLVKQVAAELGFGDPYHFSRAFKNAFGIPPARFARRSIAPTRHSE